jgi:two-component system cell cycle response regulator DivK
MPNETILVVDDAPVSLKLTDILLRKEGYKVHATSDAEQALALLRSMHPDLMLVDIQLPGMNGLELTRRVKQDSRTRDIVVVALTACAMKGDEAVAFKAGCDGYITKPIETLTLANRVREYLEQRNAPQVPEEEKSAADELRGFPGGITLAPAELESVRRRFLEEAMLQCRQLLENLDREFDVAQSIRMIHAWAEAAHALDYEVLEILAGEAEKVLRMRPPDRLMLCDALSNLMVGLAEPQEASMGSLPPALEAALKDRSVALVGLADEEAERLCGMLERVGAKPRLFEAGVKPAADAVSTCALVVVHVRPETLGTHWLHPLTVADLNQPLVLIGIRDHMLDLDPSILPRAADLLIDGWQPEEALMRLGHALARKELSRAPVPVAAPAAVPLKTEGPSQGFGTPKLPEVTREIEVLLADDDLTVRMVVRSLLQGAGIKCRMACDGNEALQVIRDCHPTAAVLDVNMPGMDGYEVLAAVRNEMIPTRVVLLTARQQEADITRGFTLGADDYVVKPFNPAELLARVKRYL